MATDIFGNPLDEEERFRQMMEQQRMGLMPGMLGGPAVDTFSDIPASLPAYGPAAGLGPSAYMGAPQGMPTYNQQPFQVTPSIMVDAVTADPTGGLAATDPSLQGITPFSQASRTSSITPFASPSYASYDKGPGWDTSAISLQSAFNPTPQEDVSYWQAPKTEVPVPQVPQRQEVAPQAQAPAPFVAPTYVAPAAPAPVDVEAIRSTVTAPAPFDFSDVSRGRLAKAREYAGQGMFGRAKQQIELGGGKWSKAMHRALKGETGMSSADLAKAKDAAVQQAKLAREAQHAANVSAAQKKHAANVKAAKAKHAENVRVAALTRQATARQAVIDAQMAAEAAARQQQQDVATVAPFTGTDSVFTGDEVNVAFGGKRNPGGGYTVGGGGGGVGIPWGEAFGRMLGAPIDEPGQIGGRLGLGLGTIAAIAAAIAMANRDKAAAAQAAFEASLDDDAMRAWNNMTEEEKAAASTGYGEGGGFMGADIGHDEGGYTGGDFSSGEGWE